MITRFWLPVVTVLGTFALVSIAAFASLADDARTENVTIHILATAQGVGETLECG